MSVSRMFEMLYILLERDRVTAAELADRLEVSVRTVYRDAQALCEAGCSTARKVCPFTLWFKGRSWYLHAYCLTRGAMRTFKLSRIRRAHIAEGDFPPEAHAAYSAGAPGELTNDAPLVPLVLRVDGCMAFRVLDDFREEETSRLEDGSFLIRTAFPPGVWVVSFILGYGGHAEVLAPEETRRAVRAALLGALARYDEKNSSRNAKT